MNRRDIKKIAWFGSSWVLGTELEKASELGLGIDQDLFRQQNRFSYCVSQHFGCYEINLAQECISSENITRKIVDYVNSPEFDKSTQMIFIVWPMIERYFWIDDKNHVHDIRYDNNHWWYRHVDNYFYRQYCFKRNVWSLQNFFIANSIHYAMINGESKLDQNSIKQDFPSLPEANWILPPWERMSDWLNFDLDNGYPLAKEKHEFFWPCENHPNVLGHVELSKQIIPRMEKFL